MDLPFTPEQFLDVMAAYNVDVWPLQIILVALALAATALAWTTWPPRAAVVMLLLAAIWSWTGIVYHGVYFRVINPVATLFAALFVFEGVLLAIYAWRGKLTFVPRQYATLGVALIGYALIVYPVVGMWVGHEYPRTPTFGLPCPTTIFTIGMLAWLKPLPRTLFIIPIVWSVIGFSAALYLGMFEDIGLLVAGVAALAILFVRPAAKPEYVKL